MSRASVRAPSSAGRRATRLAQSGAIRNADSADALRLRIQLGSVRGEPSNPGGASQSRHDANAEQERAEELRRQRGKRDQIEVQPMAARSAA